MDNWDSTAYTSTNQLLILVPHDGDISFQNAKVAHKFLLYLTYIKYSNFTPLHRLCPRDWNTGFLCEIITQFIFTFNFIYNVLNTIVQETHTYSVLSMNAKPD